MLFIIITLVIIGIWVCSAFIDTSKTAEEDEDRIKKAGKIVLITVIVLIVGILIILNSLAIAVGVMFGSCCDTAEGIGRMG
jgi:ABC-type Na+ efflux pump permease subunit